MHNWQKVKKNPQLLRKYFIRETIIKTIRQFFYQRNFREVETPTLLPSLIPESYLEVFSTDLILRDGKRKRLYLSTSPESSLKKLLSGGIGNCFSICKSFRNAESGSNYHNGEFTMLEWYRVGSNYSHIMQDCEKLLKTIYRVVKKETFGDTFNYQGQVIDMEKPFIRMTVNQALRKYSGIDLKDLFEVVSGEINYPRKKIAEIAVTKGYIVNPTDSWEEIFHQIFFNEIETQFRVLNRPVILYDYPKPLSALAKTKKGDLSVAERFEFYIAGLELGDCYSELTDYTEQSDRFNKELIKIKKLGKQPVVPDYDFLKALKSGLPDCSGIAVGIDRLVMLFTNSKTIEEVLFFPQSEF